MCDSETNDEFYIPPDLRETSETTQSSVDLPAKSKNRYELTYQSFQKWQESNNMNSVDENVLLTYFQEQSTVKTPATLWSLYSMLKSMINLQLNVNIGNYNNLLAFLKDKSKGYTSAKPKLFTDEEITKFIEEAPDITYLATKVVLIFCVSGACRTDELVNLCIDDIELHGQTYLIKIPKSETSPARSFAVCDQYFDIVRKYHLLRPPNVQSNRFFLNYQKGKCTIQVIGKNKFCKMAHEIAQFLKLEDADRYTGYSYRRTTTVLTKDSLNGTNITISPEAEAYSTISDDSSEESDILSDEHCEPPEIKDEGPATVLNLPTANSKDKYKNVYEAFKTWRKSKNASISENALLTYFQELKKTNKPNSLWAIFSMLKSTIKLNDQIDLGTFSNLITFLKQNAENYVPKKSRVLSNEDIDKFLVEAPDYIYLAMKVALIFGIMGGLRVDELVNIVETDVTEHNGIFLVRISKNKTRKPKSFTIRDEYFNIVKRYISLRCQKSPCSNRFFLTYRNGRCIVQPIGKNTLSTIPKKVAEYLNLENPQSYTGHSFRRSAVTLANSGCDLFTFKRQSGWQSSQITETCSEDSITSEIKTETLTVGMNEDTNPSEVVTSDIGLSNSEPIFCDVNNVKIEAPDSPSQADELINESYSGAVFCETNVTIGGVNYPPHQTSGEPPNSDLYFCETDAMDEELNYPMSSTELFFCDENDLDDESAHMDQSLETRPLVSNCKQVIQSPNSLEEMDKNCDQQLPKQSKEKYNSVYQKFQAWRKTKNVPISENFMLSYFVELMETMQPSSLWAMYSMLKTTIKIYDQCDIGAYSKLIAFLKRNSENYTPRKSSVLSDENIVKFLNEAPDDQFLVIKVAMIFGIMGSLRIEELVNLVYSDVSEHNGIFLVRIPKTNSKKSKSFTIHDEYFNIVKKYISLRPQKPQCSTRFFLSYRNKTCTAQPIGKNKLAAMPRKIAEFLGLENPKLYTGHSFRRTSSKLLGNANGDLFSLKQSGGLQASKIADTLSDECIASKATTSSPSTSALNLPSISSTEINSDVRSSSTYFADSGVPVNTSEAFSKNHRFSEKKAAPRCRKKRKVASQKSISAESDSSEEKEVSPSEESSSDSESKASGMDEEAHSPLSTCELVFCDEMGLVDELTPKVQLLESSPQLPNYEQVTQSQNSPEELANKPNEPLLPPQSKEKYNSVYVKFQSWRKTKNDPISEELMLSYFTELMESVKPSSLWAIFSMLKTTIKIYDQCDIGLYSNLIAFLKKNSENYTPKKSSVLSDENIAKFLNDAPDDHFLAMKVALIFGSVGGLRIDELVKIVTDDVVEHNGIFLVSIPNANRKKPKSFTIHDEYFTIVKRYTSLRPQKAGCSNRFFLTYRNRCCIVQPIGKNTLATMPRKIAEYLGLENPEFYTGHSFRRSSTTRRSNAIGNILTLKRDESWQSSKIAGSSTDESIASKIIKSNLAASTINLPQTCAKIISDLPASPIHSAEEPTVCSKRSFPEEQPSSFNSSASNKKIRISTMNSSTDNVSSKTLVARRRSKAFKRRCVGNWKRSDMNSPILARRFFDFAANNINKRNGTVQRLRSKNQRLASRVQSLKSLLDRVRESSLNSETSTKNEELQP